MTFITSNIMANFVSENTCTPNTATVYVTGGDHLKNGASMAFVTTILSWGVIEFKQAYIAGGQLDDMLDCIRWPLEYFIKCHVAPDEFYGMVCWQ